MYKIKKRPDGSIERYKTWLEAQAFSKQYGLDCDETFSLMAKLTIVTVLLALAANKEWKLWQIDVKICLSTERIESRDLHKSTKRI